MTLYKVKFLGWKRGAQKISFIKALNEQGGVSLQQAKNIKDKVVDDNEVVEIHISNEEQAKSLVQSLSKIGFIVEYEAI